MRKYFHLNPQTQTKQVLLPPKRSKNMFVTNINCRYHTDISAQLTTLFCSLQEGSYGPQVTFMPQEEGLYLTPAPVVD
jgi:hypothetical protein